MDRDTQEALINLMNAFAENLKCQTAFMRRSSTLVDQQIEANRAILPVVEKIGDIFEKAEPLIDGFIDMALEQGKAQMEEQE